MQFSQQQERALGSVKHWLQSRDTQVFRLFGYAGTGKTTLARHLAEGVEGGVIFAAYTAKAAYVMQKKGCPSAQTLHSLIYIPKDKSKARLRELEGKLAAVEHEDHKERKRLEKLIEQEQENLTRPMFSLNLDSDLKWSSLLVVDECSMVDERMGEDILGFNKPVLVLGDPAQLPPVRGGGYFTEHKPEVMLTDIHRQAENNPIIHLSRLIRERHELPSLGQYGESRVISGKMDPEEVMKADQLLVGTNRTRYLSNQKLRRLNGFKGELPSSGDRLVCLRNDGETGLINGSIWNVVEIEEEYENVVLMTLQNDDNDSHVVTVEAYTHYFRGEKPDWWTRGDAQEFDYGYALTVHKSQGSQWDSVVVIDESRVFREDWWRWLYTAVTRAAERVDLIRK